MVQVTFFVYVVAFFFVFVAEVLVVAVVCAEALGDPSEEDDPMFFHVWVVADHCLLQSAVNSRIF